MSTITEITMETLNDRIECVLFIDKRYIRDVIAYNIQNLDPYNKWNSFYNEGYLKCLEIIDYMIQNRFFRVIHFKPCVLNQYVGKKVTAKKFKELMEFINNLG